MEFLVVLIFTVFSICWEEGGRVDIFIVDEKSWSRDSVVCLFLLCF